ncbi:DUF2092 domain-containing protein [Roseomonas sp. ACRSG]|nr:DUF2092 domain-containing protein [Roseomonas sp. ACRSG]
MRKGAGMGLPLVAAFLLSGITTAPAQTTSDPAPPAASPAPVLPAPAPASPAGLSDEADQLLRAMSRGLAAAPSLAVELTVLREVALADGRTASLLSDITLAIRRPDRLRADIRGDAVLADVYYDGRKVTVHAIPQQVFAEEPAPASLDQAVPLLEDQLGVPLELGTLLVSDPYARLAPGTSGEVVSSTEISGHPAWHLILQSGPVAWELWVAQADLPLPLMVSVNRDGRRTLLRFDAWRIGPSIDESFFSFRQPPGTRPVPFARRQDGGDP